MKLTAGRIDPDVPVRHSEVRVRNAPRWMLRRYSAVALPRLVIMRRGVASHDLSGLLAHELVHVDQWKRLGVRRFLARYLGEYLAGRWRGLSHAQAYAAISLEREARQTTTISSSPSSATG